jgi:hypothetical protein
VAALVWEVQSCSLRVPEGEGSCYVPRRRRAYLAGATSTTAAAIAIAIAAAAAAAAACIDVSAEVGEDGRGRRVAECGVARAALLTAAGGARANAHGARMRGARQQRLARAAGGLGSGAKRRLARAATYRTTGPDGRAMSVGTPMTLVKLPCSFPLSMAPSAAFPCTCLHSRRAAQGRRVNHGAEWRVGHGVVQSAGRPHPTYPLPHPALTSS